MRILYLKAEQQQQQKRIGEISSNYTDPQCPSTGYPIRLVGDQLTVYSYRGMV